MNGIAIDLGSAYAMAARVNDHGIPKLIADARDRERFRTPSLIHLGAGGPVAGQAAEIASYAQPDSATLQDFKAMLASGRDLAVDSSKKGWSAEECVALLLAKLRQDAEFDCLATIDEVVLTVPGRMTSPQRRALRQAAHDAGLRVRAVVDEALAAAIYATSHAPAEQTVMVLQAGRSGFEVAIVRCSKGFASLVAARHDSSLAGKSIDQRLAEEIARAQGWSEETPIRSVGNELLRFAEEIKLDLCRSNAGQVQRQAIVGGALLEFALTQWHWEQLLSPMLESALELIDKCLRESRLDWMQMDRIVLAGGATQLPALRAALLQRSGLPDERVDAKDSVAAVVYGAALLAALPDTELAKYDRLSPSGDESAAPNVPTDGSETIAPFDFGIRIGDPRSGQAAIYRLIKRGTPLPATANKQFRTSRADQMRLVIEVVKTPGSVRRAESLGHFSLALPAGLPANHPVRVTMHCDATGQIQVEAEAAPSQASFNGG